MKNKLTAQQAADILRYHVKHVYRLLHLGAIAAEQFNGTWIIERSEVDRVRREQDDSGRYHHGKTRGQ